MKTKTKLEKIDDYVYNKAQKAVDDWFIEQIRRPFSRFYLYYKTGCLLITDNSATGLTLADTQPMPRAQTKLQVLRRVIAIAKRTPFLPDNLLV
jgi:hypothetical protein